MKDFNKSNSAILQVLNEEYLNNVTGGMADLVGDPNSSQQYTYDQVKGHFGSKINKYETQAHIGQTIIMKEWGLFRDHYYVGVVKKSYEDSCFFGTERIVEIESNGMTLSFTDPNNIWLYK